VLTGTLWSYRARDSMSMRHHRRWSRSRTWPGTHNDLYDHRPV